MNKIYTSEEFGEQIELTNVDSVSCITIKPGFIDDGIDYCFKVFKKDGTYSEFYAKNLKLIQCERENVIKFLNLIQ